MEGGGGKNGPAQSFHTPLLRRNMPLTKCFLNLNFSLDKTIMSVHIQCKSRLNLKTER